MEKQTRHRGIGRVASAIVYYASATALRLPEMYPAMIDTFHADKLTHGIAGSGAYDLAHANTNGSRILSYGVVCATMAAKEVLVDHHLLGKPLAFDSLVDAAAGMSGAFATDMARALCQRIKNDSSPR